MTGTRRNHEMESIMKRQDYSEMYTGWHQLKEGEPKVYSRSDENGASSDLIFHKYHERTTIILEHLLNGEVCFVDNTFEPELTSQFFMGVDDPNCRNIFDEIVEASHDNWVQECAKKIAPDTPGARKPQKTQQTQSM